MESIMKQLRLFDNYVVPANFFGPGAMSAYVSPTTTQHFEDLSNVHYDIRIGREFLGFVQKTKMTDKPRREQLQ